MTPEEELLANDLAMLVQRLCRRIARDMLRGEVDQQANQKMIDQAYDFLRRKGLQGSVLREETTV